MVNTQVNLKLFTKRDVTRLSQPDHATVTMAENLHVVTEAALPFGKIALRLGERNAVLVALKSPRPTVFRLAAESRLAESRWAFRWRNLAGGMERSPG